MSRHARLRRPGNPTAYTRHWFVARAPAFDAQDQGGLRRGGALRCSDMLSPPMTVGAVTRSRADRPLNTRDATGRSLTCPTR